MAAAHLAASIVLSATPLAAQAPVPDSAGFITALRFPVTDSARLFEHHLDSRLVIRVYRQVNAESRHMGWWVAVMRTGDDSGDSFNLLYHSRSWHGPYPTDLFAWHWGQSRFPDERILPVYGHPYELRIRCLGCTTEGQMPDVRFTDGVVEVAWRRVPRPYRDPA